MFSMNVFFPIHFNTKKILLHLRDTCESQPCCSSMFLIVVCVVFQGDIVDNIEQNVSKSVDHITVAQEQTKKAVRYQTKARKVK